MWWKTKHLDETVSMHFCGAVLKGLRLQAFYLIVAAKQEQVGWPLGKNAVANHPHNIIDGLLSGDRLRYRKVVKVDNNIAVIGYNALAINRVATQL